MKRTVRIFHHSAILLVLSVLAAAQTFTTTTVQGTVYGAGGAPESGTLQLTWPAFTTAAGQAVAAGTTSVTIGAGGALSVNLAPNIGSMPAGLYYTAVYHLSDGTTSTEYWVVPALAQATISEVRAQVMPAAQAVQAVNKAYVDQTVNEAVQGQMTVFGGTLTGPLYLAGDPTQPTQAADKHYVDNSTGNALPLNGGVLTGPVTGPQIGAVYQADQFAGADFGARLQACIDGLNPSYGGTCDARNFPGALTMAANLTVSVPNTTIYLPCSTISTAASIVIPAGVRNVTLHGCASEGTSAASGSQGGTVILYSGTAAAIQAGDPAYAADTLGFHLDNLAINTTAATAATAQAIAIWRTQELSLSGLYLLGNANQTAITLDGTGNYTGGTVEDTHIGGFETAVNAIGHQVANPATTDWVNASTFVRLHIDCPTASGNPMAGTTGINLLAGDGNTFTGGDVEGCGTALHLGANAQNNTLVGVRNENSSSQVAADAGSSYNDWITGGTMFTGKLTDAGTHNSFQDSFHRGFNNLNGDIWRSQADATVTNHVYTGIGLGNVRGRQDEWITDLPGVPGQYQTAWLWGPGDGTSGGQQWALQDMINNVARFGVQQLTSAGGNNQTFLNATGAGSVCFNCSVNGGTGGTVFSSGGAAPSTVATIDKSGNAQFTGTLLVDSTAQSAGTMTVRNNADAEVDYYLWPGLTASQKGAFTYKDFNGASQWYLVKDASNNWALNSAVGGLDSFKAYQSTNSGDTYIDASNATGHIRLNYETGAGAETDIYSGGSANLAAAFLNPTSIKLPGLAAGSAHNCVQIDSSGYLSNTGSPCSTGVGTVNSAASGQIAYYSANGTAISGTSAVPLNAGGTGATTAAGALANLLPGVTSDGSNGMAVTGGARVSGSLNAAGAVGFSSLAASSGTSCLQVDTTGKLSNSGAACGMATGVAAAGLTFSDASVQTTSQQGALTGAANDATARAQSTAETARAEAAESAAQSTANAAQGVTSNLPAALATQSAANPQAANFASVAAQATIAKSSQNVYLADEFSGADCGAKVQACMTQLGTTAGKCQVTQACGTSWTSAVTISGNNQGIEFTQPGTSMNGVYGAYSLCAPITLAGMNDFILGLASGSYRSNVVLQEGNGCNLANVVKITGEYATMRDVGVDGNEANNPSGEDSVALDSASRAHFLRVNFINARRDNLHVTSSAGVNASCCGRIADSFFGFALNDDIYLNNVGDWFDEDTEHENAGNLGIEAVNAGGGRVNHGDFGGDAKGGISIVENGAIGQMATSHGWTIGGGSQFYNNCGDDIFIDANPTNTTTGYSIAAYHVIVGNSFRGLAATCGTYSTPTGSSAPDSIYLHDAANTTVAGNGFAGQTTAPFNYGVHIAATLTNQSPSTVTANNFELSGFNAGYILGLPSGMDAIGPNAIGAGNGAEFAGKMQLDAPPYTGTGTTALPNFYLGCPGSTAPANWETGGTLLGGNLCSGDTRYLMDFRVNGGNTPVLSLSNGGTMQVAHAYQINTSGYGTVLSLLQNGASYFNTGYDFSIGTSSDLGYLLGVKGAIGASQHVTIPITIASSATPAIMATNGLQTITLSANATATVSGIAAGQRLTIEICQPATGGPYTWVWPSAIHGGMTIGTAANTCSIQTFDSLNGSTLVAETNGVSGMAP